ncbi:hypothetical protein C8Q80DRAFT_381469 [Daedaleopsis nitida]|nr:hypothetical protein C8Q80DRAFT_381469 [Daedaleopsis nitida]
MTTGRSGATRYGQRVHDSRSPTVCAGSPPFNRRATSRSRSYSGRICKNHVVSSALHHHIIIHR